MQAAFVMQLRAVRRTPNFWMAMVTTPVQTVLFLSVITAFDRPDLTAHALVAPAVISMWGASVWTGGAIVRNDRWGALLELHAATPSPYGLSVVGRMAATMMMSLAAIPLTLITGWVTYGVVIEIQHPWLLAASLVCTVTAMSATALIFTSMTVLSRAAITFQNSASYPILLVSGAFVPLDQLPGWVQPIGRVVFLSWGVDLIRDSMVASAIANVWWRFGALIFLGVAGFITGIVLLRIVMRRVTVTGEIAVA